MVEIKLSLDAAPDGGRRWQRHDAITNHTEFLVRLFVVDRPCRVGECVKLSTKPLEGGVEREPLGVGRTFGCFHSELRRFDANVHLVALLKMRAWLPAAPIY